MLSSHTAPRRRRNIMGAPRMGSIVAGPVGVGGWGGPTASAPRAIPHKQWLPAFLPPAAGTFGRVGQGPLDEAGAAQGGVPGEVGVPKHVHIRPQRLHPRRQGVAAHRLGQVGMPQHALLGQQLLIGQVVAEGDDRWPFCHLGVLGPTLGCLGPTRWVSSTVSSAATGTVAGAALSAANVQTAWGPLLRSRGGAPAYRIPVRIYKLHLL
mmetsp:Transcript_19147/g.57826  ORF Transcript_19147/g.57826 Transcript_19147/m.57826 type:complete len:209 (+) Transcript_19147:1448-2074(+)